MGTGNMPYFIGRLAGGVCSCRWRSVSPAPARRATTAHGAGPSQRATPTLLSHTPARGSEILGIPDPNITLEHGNRTPQSLNSDLGDLLVVVLRETGRL